MKRGIRPLFAVALLTCTVASFAYVANGQRYTKPEVNELIERAEERSDSFIELYDDGMDKSGLDGTKREDGLNERAKEFEKAMGPLRKELVEVGKRAVHHRPFFQISPAFNRGLDFASEISIADIHFLNSKYNAHGVGPAIH